jgi:hypothetical protein
LEGLKKVFVTPEVAAEWLDKRDESRPNRTISVATVSKYAAAMRNGEWKFVRGLVIQLTSDGLVLDGQHRLAAVVQSGIGQWFMVDADSSHTNFSVIDRGRPRGLHQLAGMAGCTFRASCHVSAVNTLRWDIASLGSFVNQAWSHTEISDVLHYFEPELAVVFPENFSGSSHLRNAPIRGALLRAAIAYPDKHQEILDFIEVMATGHLVSKYSHKLLEMPVRVRTEESRLSGRTSSYSPGRQDARRRLWIATLVLVEAFLKEEPRKTIPPNLAKQPIPIWLDSKPKQQSFLPYLQGLHRDPKTAARLNIRPIPQALIPSSQPN